MEFKMFSIKHTILAIILFFIIICSNDKDENIHFSGNYVVDYDVGGGTYRTTFEFTDSLFEKKFYFVDEEELVWQCKGKYEIINSKLTRNERICEFLRSEDPQLPESYPVITSNIKNITDSSFTIYLNKGENSIPDTSLWLVFKKTIRFNDRINKSKKEH